LGWGRFKCDGDFYGFSLLICGRSVLVLVVTPPGVLDKNKTQNCN
jgi:hypothetical protein